MIQINISELMIHCDYYLLLFIVYVGTTSCRWDIATKVCEMID